MDLCTPLAATEPAACRPAPVRRWREGGWQPAAQDLLAQECPVALEYNGLSHAVMLATPADLEDFALGFSLTEGLVERADQVYGIDIEHGAAGITVRLEVAAACFARFKAQRRNLAGRTGCGLCGAENLAQAIRPLAPLAHPTCFEPAALVRGMGQLRARQPLLAATGSTHAAGWCDAAGRLQLVREDVGRHNALDKLLGALLRPRGEGAGWPAAEGFVVVSSRASHEMVQKTAAAGIVLLAAVSGVTTLAVDSAEAAGLCLLGFARGADFSVYTQARRVA